MTDFTTRELKVYGRDDDDWYVEPSWCVDLLLDAERLPGTSLDPCCGMGTIPNAMTGRGFSCLGADIVDRGAKMAWPVVVHDFLTARMGPKSFDNVVMNPPYREAVPFITRALSVARHKVAVLVQQQFPYSQERHDFFANAPIARIYFLSSRPSMPPGRLLQAGKVAAKGGMVDYLWMVFEHGYRGAPTAHWLRRTKR